MEPSQLFKDTFSGVVQIFLEKDREKLGNGSGFLVEGGIITNSHVVRKAGYDAVAIRFDDCDPNDNSQYIRIQLNDVIAAESPENNEDYAFLSMDEPEFQDRHRFKLVSDEKPKVGQQVVFQGYPFGMTNLTSHVGYISSIYNNAAGVRVLQIDGSVNGGNSGGPLLSLKSGRVIGVVTRAATGIIEQEFMNLQQALRQNQQVLSYAKRTSAIRFTLGRVKVDPMQALLASQAAMYSITKNLKRSANVGIGYAFSIEYIRDALSKT